MRIGFLRIVLFAFAVRRADLTSWSGKDAGLSQPIVPPVTTAGSHSCWDVPELYSGLGASPDQGLQSVAVLGGDGRGTNGATGPKTCTTSVSTPRSPQNTDGGCGSRYCNGHDPSAYGVGLGTYNEASGSSCTDHSSCTNHGQRRTAQCYRDEDCQFYNKDSSGRISGEMVGTCERVSDTLSLCKCLEPYFGTNCEYKRCPEGKHTGFMCNGVQGEGVDYYGPYKLLQRTTSGGTTLAAGSEMSTSGGVYPFTKQYMGSEWNVYDEILQVDNHVQSYLSTSGYTVSYSQLHRGPHKVGGICDFEVGKCRCHPTYFGAACDQRTCPMGYGHDQLVKTVCSGQGTCVEEQAGQEFVCKCHSNFFGLDCSLRHCPNSTRGFICDDHGTCDTQTGFCKCDADHYGPDCTYKKCPVANGRVCNGQGVCFAATQDNSIGTMSQGNFTDYQGKKHNFAPTVCETPKAVGRLPDSTSGNPCILGGWQSGQKYGVCGCRWPYFGIDCTLKMCPNSTSENSGSGLTCDGHGTCNFQTGACTCDAGYFGPDCHFRTCPFSNKNQQRKLLECNGEGVCDRTWGRCICIGNIEGAFAGAVANSEPLGNPPEGVVGLPPLNPRIKGWFGGNEFLIVSAQLAPSYGWATKHLGENSYVRLNHRYWGKACEQLHCPSYPDETPFKPLRALHTEHSHMDDAYRPYPNECSGELQGDCDYTTGKCTCKGGWHGHDCAQRGKGDGTVNRRLHFQYDPERKLQSDGHLRDRASWHFSAEGIETPQV